jgi:hypothetical protein
MVKYKYDTYRILLVKCYIDNSVCLWSCIQNVNRVAVREEITNYEQIRLRYQELDALKEGRLQAVQNLELYRQNMVRAYDKLVKQ